MKNSVEINLHSNSINESFARIAVSGFVVQLNPTMEDLADIKTAVSEAVTNAIVHGYEDASGIVKINCSYDDDNEVTIIISDKGKGIKNLEKAMQAFYTSKPEMDRSGMGFTVMETFMDSLVVESDENDGTKVIMTKKINCHGKE